MITWLENTKLKFWREFSQYLPIYRFIWSFKHFRMDNPLSNVYTDRDFQYLKSKSLDVCIVVRHRGTKEVTMRIAHRMPYFSVLGILNYGIGWRPQNAAFENCSIWELLHLRIAPFEKCSIWELLHLRNVEFEKCWIWELLHLRIAIFEKCTIWETQNLRNMRMKTNPTFWEGCNFNQEGQFDSIQTVTSSLTLTLMVEYVRVWVWFELPVQTFQWVDEPVRSVRQEEGVVL